MSPKTNSPILFNTEEIFKTFFSAGECLIDIDFPMFLLYFLDSICPFDDDKIILINSNQENKLFDEGFTCNGATKICLDNLRHVYVQKIY